MCLEIQSLINALEAQTNAINRLVESNAAMMELLIEQIDPESSGDAPYGYDLSGKPIGN